MCCELCVICLESEHPWWNMILWTTSLLSTWRKVYSKNSIHRVLMFSQELIWRGEICYTNIVVSGLILKMRSDDTLLEKWCISLPFHYVALTIKAEHESAEHFVCHRGPSTKDSEKCSGGSRGGAPLPPLIFRPNWGPKSWKNFFWHRAPPAM